MYHILIATIKLFLNKLAETVINDLYVSLYANFLAASPWKTSW
jgi:hypothetical protein